MRFFHRPKKSEKQRIDINERADSLFWIDVALEEADLIEDPAEKILKLEDIKWDIDSRIAEEQGKVSKVAKRKRNAAELGSVALPAAGVVAVSVVTAGTAPIVAAGAYIAAMPARRFISKKFGREAHKRVKEEVRDSLDSLESRKNSITETEYKILDSNLAELSRSPLLPRVFDEAPDLQDRFAKAAARQLAGHQPKTPFSEVQTPIRKPKPRNSAF
jgi:hypothetical protein